VTVQAPDASPDDEAADTVRPGRGAATRWRRPGRLVTALIVVGLVGMWGYVVYLAVGPGRQPPIDRLGDPAFAVAAEERCAAAADDVDALPVASAAHDADERGNVLEQANAVYDEMVDDLEGMVALAPAGDQRNRAVEWVADWRTYLGDREAYARALHTDPDARLLVSEKPGQGRHITGWIDEFAKANRMPSCTTPDDA
jgi:hypothetical protein